MGVVLLCASLGGVSQAMTGDPKLAKTIWKGHEYRQSAQVRFVAHNQRRLDKAGIKATFTPTLNQLKRGEHAFYGTIQVAVHGAKNVKKAFRLMANRGEKKGIVDEYTLKGLRPNVMSSEYGAKGRVQFSVGTRSGYARQELDSLIDDG